MANRVFSVTGIAVTGQPGGQQLYFRSSNAADTADLSITGLVSAVSTTETNALLGKREVQTTDLFTSLSAILLSAAEAGVVSIFDQGVAAAGRIIVSSQPANNDTVQIGLVGFTQVYTFKTTLTGAADEVKIGAAAADTAANLNAAINAGAGAGTTYGTGTVANAYVSSTVSGSILTITDKIACRRLLGWTVSQTTGATLSIGAPSGGVEGTLLAKLNAGVTQIFNALKFASEDLVALTLPGKVAPITEPVAVGGKLCTLRFKCSNVTTAIALKYQTSTDGVNWSDGVTSIASLDNNTVAAPLIVNPAEQIEKIRLVFTSNTNTADTALDARVIYPGV
jgi:hypothetical protein